MQVFNDMTLTISEGSVDGGIYSTLNTYDDKVWPSSGSWTFQNKDKNKDRDKEAGYIECKALKINEFFLDYDGNVLPCCWLGNSLNRKNLQRYEQKF